MPELLLEFTMLRYWWMDIQCISLQPLTGRWSACMMVLNLTLL